LFTAGTPATAFALFHLPVGGSLPKPLHVTVPPVCVTVAPVLTQTVPKLLLLVMVQSAVIWWQQVHPVQPLQAAMVASVEQALLEQVPV